MLKIYFSSILGTRLLRPTISVELKVDYYCGEIRADGYRLCTLSVYTVLWALYWFNKIHHIYLQQTKHSAKDIVCRGHQKYTSASLTLIKITFILSPHTVYVMFSIRVLYTSMPNRTVKHNDNIYVFPDKSYEMIRAISIVMLLMLLTLLCEFRLLYVLSSYLFSAVPHTKQNRYNSVLWTGRIHIP